MKKAILLATRNCSAEQSSTTGTNRTRYGLLYLFLWLLGISIFPANAQKGDSTTVKAVFGSTNTELDELMSVIGIEKHHIEFNDPNLIGKLFHLTYQEFKNGVPQPEQDMTGRLKDVFIIDSTGKMAFDVYARAVDATTIEAFFRFAKVGQRKTFKVDAGNVSQYSFRTDILPYKQQQTKVPTGKKFTFLVHTLPYEKDGWYLYCSLAQSQVPVAAWYKQFGVKHFIAYQLVLE